MTINKLTKNFSFINYFLNVFPPLKKEVYQFKITPHLVILQLNIINVSSLIHFLNNHYLFKFKTLIAITAVDYPEKENRFELNYFLLSYKLNIRLLIKIYTNDMKPIPSISYIYKGAN